MAWRLPYTMLYKHFLKCIMDMFLLYSSNDMVSAMVLLFIICIILDSLYIHSKIDRRYFYISVKEKYMSDLFLLNSCVYSIRRHPEQSKYEYIFFSSRPFIDLISYIHLHQTVFSYIIHVNIWLNGLYIISGAIICYIISSAIKSHFLISKMCMLF